VDFACFLSCLGVSVLSVLLVVLFSLHSCIFLLFLGFPVCRCYWPRGRLCCFLV